LSIGQLSGLAHLISHVGGVVAGAFIAADFTTFHPFLRPFNQLPLLGEKRRGVGGNADAPSAGNPQDPQFIGVSVEVQDGKSGNNNHIRRQMNPEAAFDTRFCLLMSNHFLHSVSDVRPAKQP
jgi:hypothetical protein